MKPAQTNPSWRERQVLALLAELARERCVAKRRFARLERFLDPYLGVVDGGAIRGALRRWKRRELLRRLAQRSFFPAQIADAGSFERGLVRCRGDFRHRPVRERFQILASHVASSRTNGGLRVVWRGRRGWAGFESARGRGGDGNRRGSGRGRARSFPRPLSGPKRRSAERGDEEARVASTAGAPRVWRRRQRRQDTDRESARGARSGASRRSARARARPGARGPVAPAKTGSSGPASSHLTDDA